MISGKDNPEDRQEAQKVTPEKVRDLGGKETAREKVTKHSAGRVAKLDTNLRKAGPIRGLQDMWQRGRREGARRRREKRL